MKSYSETVNEAAKKESLTMQHKDIRGPATETDAQRAERTGLSSVRLSDDASRAVQKTENRITLDSMIAKISHVDYVHPERHPHMTIAIVTLANGFILVGKSTPADPENFNEELGKKFAYEDSIRQMWQLEGYLLREKLWQTQTSST